MFEILEYSNKIKELYIGKDTINKIIEAYKKSIIENEESIKKIYDIDKKDSSISFDIKRTIDLLETYKDMEDKPLDKSTKSIAICPICGKEFKTYKRKIYCSDKCKYKSKNYPSIEEVNEQYEILHSWEKVANHFNLTRRIIQGIRNRAV